MKSLNIDDRRMLQKYVTEVVDRIKFCYPWLWDVKLVKRFIHISKYFHLGAITRMSECLPDFVVTVSAYWN